MQALLVSIHEAGDALARAYFSSQVLALGPLHQQEVQQQQCG